MNRLALLAVIALMAPQTSHAQWLQNDKLLADSNKDGKVSLGEYQASRSKFLMTADRNKDGKISQAEWTNGAALLRPG